MERSRLSLRLALVLLAALGAAAAPAQTLWYEHYQRGIELEEHSSWDPAFLEFQAAVRLEQRPRKHVATYGRNFIFEYDPHFHMARCLTELGRYPAAAAQLRLAFKANVTPKAKLDALRARLEELVRERVGAAQPKASPATAGRLVVSARPVGARVSIDGADAGVTPLGPLAVEAGDHVVTIEASGFRPVEERVTIEAAGTYTLDRDLQPLPTRPPVLPASAPVIATAPTAVASTPAPHRSTQAPPQVVIAPTPAPVAATPAAGLESHAGQAPPPTAPPATLATPRAAGSTLLAPVLLALLLLAVAAGSVWWVLRRRRPRDAAHTPTRILEDTPTQVRAGTALKGYTLTGMLGRGGMATTFSATRTADGSLVALKVPHEGCLADPTFVARFLREGRLGEQLHHPRIVRIYEADEQDGRPFLAMELLAGRTLKQELRERGTLPLRRALEIAADIAEALDYAHVKGVVHRDLKPENVMVLPDGGIKVMDFGIARLEGQESLTSSQFFLGTPLYAAPEMIEPKRIDRRVDLYSLGIILFEMLEGTVPFSADSPFRVLQMHQHDPLPARDGLSRPVPAPVWRVIARLCEKGPDDRYRSAEALLVELHALLRDFSTLGVDAG